MILGQLVNKTILTVQVHYIPYFIYYNPQKHPQFPSVESSKPQNKMKKEFVQLFTEDAALGQVYLSV